MFYREAGLLKTSYAAEMALFPIPLDRYGVLAILVLAFVVIPFAASEYFVGVFMIPLLIWALAALGLNVLLGYCGQLSLGHGGFMAVGAYAAYNFATRLPELNLIVVFLLAGLCAAAVGMVFGLPCLRLRGWYLAVATLAAQFVIEFVLTSFSWFTGDNAMGALDTPAMVLFGHALDSTLSQYYLVLGFVCVLALLVKNLTRSAIGRAWMAVRDMDVAAEIIGIRPWPTKLTAFAVSAFMAGVAGALYAFVYLKSCNITAFGLPQSFQILFMVIVGGLGSILGSFLGAAFMALLPIGLSLLATVIPAWSRPGPGSGGMIFGGLIIFFLIVEPRGLAHFWVHIKQNLRVWPFPR
ncbi:MAG: branched-chain amino acid ABC transporter permease [Alphaproteobacteria bacterium]|jgi:branched-chain amino acid transport system permease protein|nr:branched-chain amino acid ABC transporter permease [Alphaproteobacteria bacterium]MDP6815416.1 branched-chain amino acid ABC transporter permease [Alphaproteobacteria bacterium]